MPRDPVCGVILNDKTAKFKISHEGEKIFFCSVKCKKKFKRNRSKFVKQTEILYVRLACSSKILLVL